MALVDHEIQFVRDLVRRHSAIALEPDKAYLIESRLTALCRPLGLASPAALIQELRSKASADLIRRVVDAMTVNETSFFRDVHPFAALRHTVLPAILEARAKTRSLSIWCAASASGQEPYSIAMVLRDHFPQLAGWSVRLLATDLSRDMVERARTGRYSQFEVNRGLPAPMLVKHFVQRGSEWEVAPAIRQMIEFRELNLAEPLPAMPAMDLVFLRNVLIYFDAASRQQVLVGIRRVMQPHGWLCLGSGESTVSADDQFERVPLGSGGIWHRATVAEGTLPPGSISMAAPGRATQNLAPMAAPPGRTTQTMAPLSPLSPLSPLAPPAATAPVVPVAPGRITQTLAAPAVGRITQTVDPAALAAVRDPRVDPPTQPPRRSTVDPPTQPPRRSAVDPPTQPPRRSAVDPPTQPPVRTPTTVPGRATQTFAPLPPLPDSAPSGRTTQTLDATAPQARGSGTVIPGRVVRAPAPRPPAPAPAHRPSSPALPTTSTTAAPTAPRRSARPTRP